MIKQSTRDGFGQALYQLVQDNSDIIVLSADLSDSLRVDQIKQDFPAQYVECGICEQNMAGVAAGIAMTGQRVVICSFAVFNPGRNWEQIRVSICEQNLDVKVVGGHAGLATGADGATHQALEDIALTTVLPHMQVITACDALEAQAATQAMLAHPGPFYLRLSREPVEPVDQGQTKFALGRGRLLQQGEDAYIIACGSTVPLALAASQQLRQQANLSIGVVNLPTIKPLDHALLAKIAAQTHTIITIEEHQLIGGLGSAIASYLSTHEPVIMEMIGIDDQFGQSGTTAQLWSAYGLTIDHLQDKILQALERKVASTWST